MGPAELRNEARAGVVIRAAPAHRGHRREWSRANGANLALATKKLEGVIASIRKRHPAVRATKSENYKSMFGGGTIERTVETTLHFPMGTVLGDDVVPEGVAVLEKVQPVTYTMQVVSAPTTAAAIEKTLENTLHAGVEMQ